MCKTRNGKMFIPAFLRWRTRTILVPALISQLLQLRCIAPGLSFIRTELVLREQICTAKSACDC